MHTCSVDGTQQRRSVVVVVLYKERTSSLLCLLSRNCVYIKANAANWQVNVSRIAITPPLYCRYNSMSTSTFLPQLIWVTTLHLSMEWERLLLGKIATSNKLIIFLSIQIQPSLIFSQMLYNDNSHVFCVQYKSFRTLPQFLVNMEIFLVILLALDYSVISFANEILNGWFIDKRDETTLEWNSIANMLDILYNIYVYVCVCVSLPGSEVPANAIWWPTFTLFFLPYYSFAQMNPLAIES